MVAENLRFVPPQGHPAWCKVADCYQRLDQPAQESTHRWRSARSAVVHLRLNATVTERHGNTNENVQTVNHTVRTTVQALITPVRTAPIGGARRVRAAARRLGMRYLLGNWGRRAHKRVVRGSRVWVCVEGSRHRRGSPNARIPGCPYQRIERDASDPAGLAERLYQFPVAAPLR